MDIFVGLMWAVACIVWIYAIGNYLSGVIEFKSWKWPNELERSVVPHGAEGLIMWCWHKWGKWSDPTNGIYMPMGEHGYSGVGYFAVAQIRICGKCGIAQHRTLPKVRSLESLKAEK